MRSCLLLSGGMDSISIAWWKKPELALTIDYGQLSAAAELQAATITCKMLNIEHHTIKLDCRALGSGDMAGTAHDSNAPASDWWPYRNQLLITFATMKAISLNVNHLWFGTVKSDWHHKDGTKEFFTLINSLVSFQEGHLKIEAPAIDMTTQELIRVSKVPKEILAYAHSCHTSIVPCGMCRGCNKYYEVYEELGYDLDRPWQPITA